jgi:hypothetical protein
MTKNDRALIMDHSVNDFDRERAQRAAEELRALLAEQGPPISQEEAQANWERLKHELDSEDDDAMERWLSS